jgi:transcription termination/antitermination protein NusG
MDEREPQEQPEEEPRDTGADSAQEPQAPQVDLPRSESTDDVPAAVEEAEQAPVTESPLPSLEPVSADDAADSAPADEPRESEPSVVAEAVSAEAEALPVVPNRTSAERRGGQLAQGEVPPEASVEPAWYVIHCYSGYENKVRHNLEQRIETMGMKDKIFDVVIPTQEEIEVREGKRRTVERHIFPGYVLVNMSLSEESWYVVRNTPGVTGFVGMGNLPTPLRPEEVAQIVKRMEAEAPAIKVSFKVGERVRIIDGPFNDFRGTVAEIFPEHTKVRVMVSFFGRETPVELDFLQVERA